MVIESNDLLRLEAKVDRLTEAVSGLVRVEERLANQGHRTGLIEERLSAVETHSRTTERKVDQWVNRGLGVWALILIIFALYKALHGNF